jgi:7-cyano-7-deazaguanine synthase in queuosine biosynthesis
MLCLSGGLDSATVLFTQQVDECLVVNYGQPHVAEIRLARTLAGMCGVPVREVHITYSQAPTGGIMGGNDLTPSAAVVPGRNSMFVALAAMHGAAEVLLGCNADDQDAFVDCRLDNLRRVSEVCGVQVTLPLAGLTKAQVKGLAMASGVPVDLCLSCYRGSNCGECAACRLRFGR